MILLFLMKNYTIKILGIFFTGPEFCYPNKKNFIF